MKPGRAALMDANCRLWKLFFRDGTLPDAPSYSAVRSLLLNIQDKVPGAPTVPPTNCPWPA